jgi:hypothetical protein
LLTEALNGFQIREKVKLKATDTKHLHKPVKMTLRMRDKLSSGPEVRASIQALLGELAGSRFYE